MRFILIDARQKHWRPADFEIIDDAKRALGINPAQTDHGVLAPGVGYIVYEFGFFVPAHVQCFAAIGNRLIAGNAVLYGFDRFGKEVEINTPPAQPRFFSSVKQIEEDIARGLIQRPQMSRAGVVFWQWPQPAPEGFGR